MGKNRTLEYMGGPAGIPVPRKRVPRGSARPRFGQLLVETKYGMVNFAKEAANAILIQAEMNGKTLDYSPNGTASVSKIVGRDCLLEPVFVTRTEGREHVLEFEGDAAGYLKIPGADAASFHVSFREADASDKLAFAMAENSISTTALLVAWPVLISRMASGQASPGAYVLTLSASSSVAGEFGDEGFWGQLGNNLYTGLSSPGPRGSGRMGDPDARITIIYGNGESFKVLKEGK